MTGAANRRGAERHYFSNGSEHRAWEPNWCGRCVHDHAFSHGPDDPEYGDADGCPIILTMVIGEDAPEIIEVDGTPVTIGDKVFPTTKLECIAFMRCSCDNGPDDPPGPTPPPEPMPGQEALFDIAETPVGIIWRTDPAEYIGVEVPA